VLKTKLIEVRRYIYCGDKSLKTKRLALIIDLIKHNFVKSTLKNVNYYQNMKTIPYFKTTVLIFGLIISQACTTNDDFYFLDGSAHKLSDYQGKWLIFNFWAEWCAPCREEIPELNRLHSLSEQQNVIIIGVSYDPLSNTKIQQIKSAWAIKYPIIATKPMPILPFALPKTLPGNYIINPDGELVAKLSGTQSLASITKSLNSLKKKHLLSQ
jgi:thiol-disulfide isomerase/thioredoxin